MSIGGGGIVASVPGKSPRDPEDKMKRLDWVALLLGAIGYQVTWVALQAVDLNQWLNSLISMAVAFAIFLSLPKGVRPWRR